MKIHDFKLSSLALLLLVCLPFVAFGEDEETRCVPPGDPPAVPDGRRSSQSQMTEAMAEVREYLGYSAGFRECVEKLLLKQGDDAPEKVKKAALNLIQESLETDELLGSLFNQQVRVFKSLNPPD